MVNLDSFWSQVLQWPAIVQGLIGSFLFWLAFEAAKRLFGVIGYFLARVNHRAEKGLQMREYIYRKYTSSNGLLPFTQGSLISIMRAMQYFANASVFFMVGYLIKPIVPFSDVIGTAGALYYLFKALSWLKADDSWKFVSAKFNLTRIKSLEESLFGKADEDTEKWLSELGIKEQQDKIRQAQELLESIGKTTDSRESPTLTSENKSQS